MKHIITLIICAGLIIFTSYKSEEISDYLANIISENKTILKEEKNNYAKNASYEYIKIEENFIPYSYQDLLNIIYTIIDSGYNTITFYCPNEYNSCINDISKISSDELILTHINNYVHPYNSFTNIETTIYDSREITMRINKVYNEEEISYINSEIEDIISKYTSIYASNYDNIKSIHDYIASTTKYDEDWNKTSSNKSNTAYGTLKNHLATCNGYTDLMAIILSKMNIDNYKIATTPNRISYASEGHIWNAVYLNNEWLHLDLTWDDPVTETGQDYLHHKYFLINNEELKNADEGEVVVEEHNFDKSVYLEFNDSIKDIIS